MPESDAAAPDHGGGPRAQAFDTADLRQRMLVAFSAQELAEIAATRGVPAGGARADAHAREIIKSYEREGELGALVDRLRAARPLLEWPDAATPEEPAAPVDAPAAAPAEGAPAEVDAAPPTTPAGTEPVGAAATRPDAPPASAPWPGVVPEAAEPARDRGLDPRLLVLVSGLTLIAALVAFAAGRVSSGPRPADEARAAAPARRAPGLATHAADAVARRLAGVASACEIPATDDVGVMRRAAERCGPAPAPRPRPTPPPTEPAATAAPEATDEPAAGRYGIPAPTPAARAPGEGPCLRGCEATHAACTGRCGNEPTQGSQYADYQQCLAKCLSAASKCRLACQ